VLETPIWVYNSRADITGDTAMGYASNRDVLLLLVDDLNPIEADKLPERQALGLVIQYHLHREGVPAGRKLFCRPASYATLHPLKT